MEAKQLKVVLIAVHQISMDEAIPLHRCLGVLALAASLQKSSIDCEILNLRDFNNSINQEYEEFMSALVERIIITEPDILGFSTMSNNLPLALDLSRRIKDKQPNLHIMLGGPGASFQAVEILQAFPSIDAIIRGEADFAFPLYVQARIRGETTPEIPGLVYNLPTGIVDNGWPAPIIDLDDLPIPMYGLCEVPKGYTKAISLEIGRGCPFKCIFCSTSAFFKRKYRTKSVERVIEEICYIEKELGVRNVLLTHDLLTFDSEYLLHLCRRLENHNPPIRWACSARLDTINQYIIKKMTEAGCRGVFIGIEVGTSRMQKLIGKRLNLNLFHDVIQLMVKYDLPHTLSFIVGIPGEERADLKALLALIFQAKMLSSWKASIQIHVLTPEPGSKILADLKDTLVYDDQGSPGTSGVPPHWKPLKRMIEDNPQIFPAFFHLKTSLPRKESLLYVYLGELIDGLSGFSLRLAYSYLEDSLPELLVNEMQKIDVPLPNPFNSDRFQLMQSFRVLISSYLSYDIRAQRCYNSIAEYEIAVNSLQSGTHSISIEVWFDPVEIIKELTTTGRNPVETLEYRKRVILVFWDDESKSVKSAEIPDALINFIEEYH